MSSLAESRSTDNADAGISLSLQTLIDTRFDTKNHNQKQAKGLSPLSGLIQSHRRGQGLEFEDLRAYAVGDDVRHIDWRASARHNALFTRIYREERELLLTIAVDFTAAMFTGSTELKAVQAGRMAARLAWQCVGAGGRCGLLIHTDAQIEAVRPAVGDKAALAICSQLATQFKHAKSHAAKAASAARASPNQKQSSEEMFARLQTTVRLPGPLLVLSGLDNIDETSTGSLKALAAQKRIAVICVDDPLEYAQLPSGTFDYQSAGNRKRLSLNAKQAQVISEHLEKQHVSLTQFFADAHVPLLFSRSGEQAIEHSLTQLGFIA